MTESQNPSLPDTETGMLMPQSSPRPASRRPNGHLANGARPYISDPAEHEYAALADQLDALQDDIHHARQRSTEAQRAPGRTAHREAEAPPPSPRGESVALADGMRILIRPVEPHDAQQLRTGFEHLSAVSRYRRFLTQIDHLSERQLTYLTDVDHEQHEALVALDAATGDGLGIARFACDPEDPAQAEVTLVVADLWQGHGVGRVLIQRLAIRARAVGVERFTARMLIGNHAGHRLLVRVADELSEHEDAGTMELTARLRTE